MLTYTRVYPNKPPIHDARASRSPGAERGHPGQAFVVTKQRRDSADVVLLRGP